MRAPFEIAGQTVAAGNRATVDLPVAKLYTHTDMTMPVHVVHGKKAGPVMFISAAIHGDEIIGVEIIRRLLQLKILHKLHGTLIAIPVVNVFGFLNHSRYLPDRRDLNRFFPGTEKGSLTSRLAHLFMEEIVARCSHGIDLHTGSNHRINLPQIRAYLDDPETERLAYAFGAPVILDADLLEGSLRQAVKDRDIQMLLYEAGEVLRFHEVPINVGVRGVIAVMRAIGMLNRAGVRPLKTIPVIARASTWVRAPMSGLLSSKLRLGDRVREGSKIAEICDPFGEGSSEVIATATGIVIGALKLPLVHKGDALFHVARFEKPAFATQAIASFRQEFEPDA